MASTRDTKPASANRRTVRKASVTDPEQQRAVIDRATSAIKTDARLDFVRSIRRR